jgi:hypothetical protein
MSPRWDILGQSVATFERRVGKTGKVTWRVKVRRLSGPFVTQSFAKKSDGEEWARSIEHRIDVGDRVPSSEAVVAACGLRGAA